MLCITDCWGIDMSIRLCKDCRHCKVQSFYKSDDYVHQCNRPIPSSANMSLVTGRLNVSVSGALCSLSRESKEMCGIEAKYFEPKASKVLMGKIITLFKNKFEKGNTNQNTVL